MINCIQSKFKLDLTLVIMHRKEIQNHLTQLNKRKFNAISSKLII